MPPPPKRARALDAAPARLEIFFDLACPFCLLAKLSIDQLQRTTGLALEISWSPLILYPQLPAEGIDFQTAHSGKYGERARELQLQVERRAAAFGLVIDHSRIGKVPNTIDAHRVVQFAARGGRAGVMIEALLRGNFTDYRDLTNRDDLVAIGAGAGFDAHALRRYLALEGSRVIALAAHESSVRRGVRSVPSYELNGYRVESTVDLLPQLQLMTAISR
jgi:predicted DsbA family dithiol-disulfide isomerase